MGRLSAKWLKANGFDKTEVLIETGAGAGTGIKYCARLFPVCHTTAKDYAQFVAAKKFLASIPNVKVHHGDSAAELAKLCNPKKSTTRL